MDKSVDKKINCFYIIMSANEMVEKTVKIQ